MALRSKNKVSANFNMSSMTDIVFLLLIFFIIQVPVPSNENLISILLVLLLNISKIKSNVSLLLISQ